MAFACFADRIEAGVRMRSARLPTFFRSGRRAAAIQRHMRYVQGVALAALTLSACFGDDRPGPGVAHPGPGSDGSGSDGSGSGSSSVELGAADGSGQAISELGFAADDTAM